MLNPSSHTIDEVIKNIVKDVLQERVEQAVNQETVLAEEVRKETEEVEVEIGEDRVFLSNKRA